MISAYGEVIQRHFIRLRSDSFKAAFQLLGIKKSWHHIKTQNKRLRELEYLCLKYATPIRNQLVHGNYWAYQPNELELLYNIDKAFITELELMVQKYCNGNTILNHTPTQFGAKKGTINDTLKIGRILNQSPGLRPMPFSEAKRRFDGV